MRRDLFPVRDNYALGLWRQLGIQMGGRDRCPVEDGVKDNGGGFSRKRHSPCRHLIEHGPEAEQVGAVVEVLAAGLLCDSL